MSSTGKNGAYHTLFFLFSSPWTSNKLWSQGLLKQHVLVLQLVLQLTTMSSVAMTVAIKAATLSLKVYHILLCNFVEDSHRSSGGNRSTVQPLEPCMSCSCGKSEHTGDELMITDSWKCYKWRDGSKLTARTSSDGFHWRKMLNVVRSAVSRCAKVFTHAFKGVGGWMHNISGEM